MRKVDGKMWHKLDTSPTYSTSGLCAPCDPPYNTSLFGHPYPIPAERNCLSVAEYGWSMSGSTTKIELNTCHCWFSWFSDSLLYIVLCPCPWLVCCSVPISPPLSVVHFGWKAIRITYTMFNYRSISTRVFQLSWCRRPWTRSDPFEDYNIMLVLSLSRTRLPPRKAAAAQWIRFNPIDNVGWIFIPSPHCAHTATHTQTHTHDDQLNANNPFTIVDWAPAPPPFHTPTPPQQCL